MAINCSSLNGIVNAVGECISLEVLQPKKLVTPKCAIFTSFSTEVVEDKLVESQSQRHYDGHALLHYHRKRLTQFNVG